jgi:two-component system chemotaxis sensor kinase CheA
VRAQVKADEVLLSVSDDGAGIDATSLRRVAETRGFRVSAEQPYAVLFEPGFTTRASADLGSGRGVGLSAVRDAVRAHSGEVRVESRPGAGTTFELRLPLSVSIVRALLLEADGERYAVPLTAVLEGRRLGPGERHEVNRAGVVRWREQAIALLDLGTVFGTRRRGRPTGYVVIIEAGGRRRGLVADAIRGHEEIVVKGLDAIVGHPAGVAGSTILGDGRAILILDPRSLVKLDPAELEVA